MFRSVAGDVGESHWRGTGHGAAGFHELRHFVNAADLPTIGKEREYKNDRFDSRKLVRELENGSLECFYMPDKDNLNLRDLTRRMEQVAGNIE